MLLSFTHFVVQKIIINDTCLLGSDCTSATLLQKCNLKKVSYPFDWLESNIPDIIDCIKTNFKHFLFQKRLKVNNHTTEQDIQNLSYFMNEYTSNFYTFFLNHCLGIKNTFEVKRDKNIIYYNLESVKKKTTRELAGNIKNILYNYYEFDL